MNTLNIILPVWIIFLFSWPLLLLVICGNFLIDLSIYKIFAYKTKTTYTKKWKYIFSAYVLGFAADIIGAVLLYGVYAIDGLNVGYIFIYDSWYSILIHVVIVAMTAVVIYLFNRVNLNNTDLTHLQQHRLALIMAIATAPYTFLIPAILFS